jgi:dTDP-4-amino-4,6-dideoxygalactose transaminase
LAKSKCTLEGLNSDKIIRLSKSCLREGEKAAVLRVLDKGFLGMGEEVQLFEQKLSEFFGRPAICVVNGTAALHLALQACEIGIGDEVLVPSITYVSSYQSITATGAKPISCDISSDSLCIDPVDAEKRLTEKTKAIMPVHYSGGVGDLDGVYEFAQRHNLRVVEDAAHAFGTVYKSRKIGSFGDIACFSFDGIKNITSGEGGCIVSDNLEFLNLVRDARLLGVEKDSEKRYTDQRSWAFDVKRQGWRYHMSNIMAAIGIEQLARFDEISQKRRSLAKRYVEILSSFPSVRLINHDYTEVVPHIFVVQIPKNCNRERIIKFLKDRNIQTGIHYLPNHQLSFFEHSDINGELDVTNDRHQKLLTLPLHEDLNLEEVKYIAQSFLEAIEIS